MSHPDPLQEGYSPVQEFDEDHESVAWAIKDTGFNIDIIANQVFQVLSRDQVSQLINRLTHKLDL